MLTGATGYVGGLLLRALQGEGRAVRCLARRPAALAARAGPATEVVRGDVLDAASLGPALHGVEVAYYLVHAMGEGGAFAETEARAAATFARAARAAGVRRIVYLGGLGHGPGLSPHLQSRQAAGEILREHGPQVVELRASVVIGAGSTSFEMVRALVERLPLMVTPRWVGTETQPIAATDVVEYLRQAADLAVEGHRTFEIGGADVMTYGDLMMEYARQRGLRRRLIPVPVLTPRLSSLWLHLVTPFQAEVGRHLIVGLRNPTLVRDDAARGVFDVRPLGVRDAIGRALEAEDAAVDEAARDAALVRDPAPAALARARLFDTRVRRAPCRPEDVLAVLERIGGQSGWYFANGLWTLRGALDRLAGGPGMRRHERREPLLHSGDRLDCWRVAALDRPRRLLLRAEMRMPGRAWLQWEVAPGDGGCRVRQTALFDPRGLLGRAYWFGVLPLHAFVFSGLLRNLVRRAVTVSRKSMDERAGAPARLAGG